MEVEEKEHHIWCNDFHKPRKGCQMCERLYREYSYKKDENPEEMMKRYFPNNIIRKGT